MGKWFWFRHSEDFQRFVHTMHKLRFIWWPILWPLEKLQLKILHPNVSFWDPLKALVDPCEGLKTIPTRYIKSQMKSAFQADGVNHQEGFCSRTWNKHMLVGFASSSTDAQHREQKFKDKSATLCNMNAEMVWILLWIQSSRRWTYWRWLVLAIILYTMLSMERSCMIWMNGPCAKGVWKGTFQTFPARV